MAIEHDLIPDADLHEPKGVNSASAKQVYVADGAGSGSWQDTGISVHGDAIITGNTTATAVTAAVDATLATDSDYTKVTAGWTLAHGDGISLNVDEVVVSVAGTYQIMFWADVKVPTNNNFIGIKYVINDTAPYSNRKLIAQSTSANDILNISGMGVVVNLNANDTISIYTAATKTDNLVFQEAGVVVILLHEGP